MQLTNEQIRDKYIKLAKSNGVARAVTALHCEIGDLEVQIFDGGYEKARLQKVEFMRGLARELFTLQFNLNSEENKNG